MRTHAFPPPSPPILVRALILAGVSILGLVSGSLAQEPQPQPEPGPAPPAAVVDTTAAEELERSPRGAFLRSLVLPGWGQAWVGAPVRGGVYFAMEAGALWMTYKSRQKLREARQQEAWLRESGQLAPDQPFALVRAREDQAEDWITLAIFLLFFSGADAYVAAHLADFGDRVGVLPAPGGGMQLQAIVPVGGPR